MTAVQSPTWGRFLIQADAADHRTICAAGSIFDEGAGTRVSNRAHGDAQTGSTDGDISDTLSDAEADRRGHSLVHDAGSGADVGYGKIDDAFDIAEDITLAAWFKLGDNPSEMHQRFRGHPLNHDLQDWAAQPWILRSAQFSNSTIWVVLFTRQAGTQQHHAFATLPVFNASL